MAETTNRRELKAEYRQTDQGAGVYRIVNTRSGMSLVGTSTNLRSIKNRLEFARSTKSPGALDGRLKRALEEDGFEAFEFEVLATLEPDPTRTAAATREELAGLEKLWRAELGEDRTY
jgi:hypothetical protein